jgi:hypothetical protein
MQNTQILQNIKIYCFFEGLVINAYNMT